MAGELCKEIQPKPGSLGKYQTTWRARETKTGGNALPKPIGAKRGCRGALVTQESLCVQLLPRL